MGDLQAVLFGVKERPRTTAGLTGMVRGQDEGGESRCGHWPSWMQRGCCKAQALTVTVRYNLAIPYFIFSRGDRLGKPIVTVRRVRSLTSLTYTFLTDLLSP